jgi:UPA domain
MAGNLIPIAKTEDQLNIVFRAFIENRLAFPVRLRDSIREPSARLSFMQEPRQQRGQTAVCTLIVHLPDFVQADVNANLEKSGN